MRLQYKVLNVAILFWNLNTRLWQATEDVRVLTEVARILSIIQEDARKLLEGGEAEE